MKLRTCKWRMKRRTIDKCTMIRQYDRTSATHTIKQNFRQVYAGPKRGSHLHRTQGNICRCTQVHSRGLQIYNLYLALARKTFHKVNTVVFALLRKTKVTYHKKSGQDDQLQRQVARTTGKTKSYSSTAPDYWKLVENFSNNQSNDDILEQFHDMNYLNGTL